MTKLSLSFSTKDPLNKAVRDLVEIPTLCFGEPSPGESYAIGLQKASLKKVLVWVLYRQGKIDWKRNRFPLNTPEFRSKEHFGEMFSSLYDLCRAACDFLEEFGGDEFIDARDPAEWWFKCMLEIEQAGLHSISFLGRNDRPKNVAKSMQESLKQLRALENPCKEDGPEFKNWFELFEVAISICTRNPRDPNDLKRARTKFIKGAWDSFIRHYASVKAYYRKTGVRGVSIDDNGRAYVMKDRNQTQILCPIPKITKIGYRGRNAQVNK